MKLYSGSINTITDVSIELGRLHALCDLVCGYSESYADAPEVENNISFGLQMIHDMVVVIEDAADDLAAKAVSVSPNLAKKEEGAEK